MDCRTVWAPLLFTQAAALPQEPAGLWDQIRAMDQAGDAWWVWTRAGLALVAAILALWLAKLLVLGLVRALGSERWRAMVGTANRYAGLALVVSVGLLVVRPFVPALLFDLEWLERLVAIATIASFTWLAVVALEAGESVVYAAFNVEVEDNLRARRMHTQARVLARSLQVLAVVLGLAGVLMTFPDIRQIGASLLASAGLAGLVLGLAARPVVANLIAGVQIAITQPIRIDDVVIIEDEWGWIEEITATYVVVKIWDERRLVVPLSKFIEEPFQNWTRRSSRLLGTVFVHCDYAVPVDAVRRELERIVSDDKDWDRRVAIVEVTEANDRTMELRALVSSASSPRLWDLRCRVREGLIAFLQREHPGSLPRARVDLGSNESSGVPVPKGGG